MVAKRSALDWFLSIGIWLLFVILLVPAIALGFVVGRSEKQDTTTVVQTPAMAAKSLIKSAPAFSTDDLWQTASDDWITNGGSTSNQRYSSLDEINDSNVQNLKGVWLTHLRKSGIAAKYSAESQPLEYQGVIYVPTGQDDVFAVSADTGEILWEYKAHLDQTISIVCCGWESRGVALGEGKVYIGQLDGVARRARPEDRQVVVEDAGRALAGRLLHHGSAALLRRAWSSPASPAASSAPRQRHRLRRDDREAEMALLHDPRRRVRPATTRGRRTTTPGRHGGAPVWQTPSVDPELGTALLHDGQRVARQQRQQSRRRQPVHRVDRRARRADREVQVVVPEVHHDIWDYDAPSPTILFDATVNGKDVKGIGEAEKTGWVYLLNRETGKPLFPTPEKKVPQEVNQKTWPTQPFPPYEPSSRTRSPTSSTRRC